MKICSCRIFYENTTPKASCFSINSISDLSTLLSTTNNPFCGKPVEKLWKTRRDNIGKDVVIHIVAVEKNLLAVENNVEKLWKTCEKLVENNIVIHKLNVLNKNRNILENRGNIFRDKYSTKGTT